MVLFEDFQPLVAIATTPNGAKRLQPLTQATGTILWVPESMSGMENVQAYSGSLKDHIAHLWNTHRGFIFCLATGAVVRLIAPLLEQKSRDPAIVVVDESGQFAISLCSGHQGGADQLTRLIALQIGAKPILTGASTKLGLPGIDILGVPFGWSRGEGDWTGVSAAVARGEPVQVIQEVGSTLWQSHLPQKHSFLFGFPEYGETDVATDGLSVGGIDEGTDEMDVATDGLSVGGIDRGTDGETDETDGLSVGGKSELTRSSTDKLSAAFSVKPKARIWISPTQRRFSPESDLIKVQWHPRVLWVGVGCERGTSRQLIEAAIQQTLKANHLAEGAIAGIATIDIKADEVGLLELCQERNLPLQTFPAEVLRGVTVPNPSTVVEAEVGTPSVAEAAAICAAQCQILEPIPKMGFKDLQPQMNTDKHRYLVEDQGFSDRLLVSKQIFYLDAEGTLIQNPQSKIPNRQGAVTVAIAQSEIEYTGRKGQLLLIGIGPGQLDQITPSAQTAIAQADAVIGYSLYIDLISSLLRPGQIVEALPITQERQRAERAIALAQWGLTVAVVSSGDCGIYGMAGLVLEELQALGWDGKTPSVQVFPGITALQSASARVGAALMHDFCAISLSDLLTPWEVIEKRLTAAAQADFVTALYNPRSHTRTQQIVIAQKIFLQYRNSDTPVAIVRSAYREDEQITLTTLDKFLDIPIDMLTTILIGNQSTRTYAEWMITPRGYLGFNKESTIN